METPGSAAHGSMSFAGTGGLHGLAPSELAAWYARAYRDSGLTCGSAYDQAASNTSLRHWVQCQSMTSG